MSTTLHPSTRADSSRADTVPDPDSLAGLLALAAEGDDQAFQAFYSRTRAQTQALVRGLVRSPETTADVVQEVYATAWQNAARYDPARGAVQAWLGTLARRKAIDRIRQMTRQTTRDLAHARQAGPEEAADEVWERVLHRAQCGQVRAALQTLAVGKREVLRLTYLEGCTTAQIADRLGLPVGTVKTRRRDGLLMLRVLLQAAG